MMKRTVKLALVLAHAVCGGGGALRRRGGKPSDSARSAQGEAVKAGGTTSRK